MRSGGKAFFLYILDVGSQTAEGIYKNGYRTVLHALGSRDGMRAWCACQIGGHKTHGGACCLDVDGLGHVTKCGYYYFCIIAVAQMAKRKGAACHSMDDKGAVADTLGGWQLDSTVDLLGCLNDICHVMFCFLCYLTMITGKSRGSSVAVSVERVLGRSFLGPGMRGL